MINNTSMSILQVTGDKKYWFKNLCFCFKTCFNEGLVLKNGNWNVFFLILNWNWIFFTSFICTWFGVFLWIFYECFIPLICIGMVLLTSQGRFILDHPQIMKKYLLFLTYWIHQLQTCSFVLNVTMTVLPCYFFYVF